MIQSANFPDSGNRSIIASAKSEKLKKEELSMEREKKLGILIGAGSYFIWGILPMYWKLAGEIDAVEILAHRMIWSFVFMVVLIGIFGKWSEVMTELRLVSRKPRTLLAITAATL